MINKINKGRRRSMDVATPYDPATSGKGPRRTPNKNRTEHKTSHPSFLKKRISKAKATFTGHRSHKNNVQIK
jgi:hypothetical protein